MRRFVRFFAFAIALLALLFACGGDEVTSKEAGLEVILTTDLAQPKDIDRIQIDVNQAGANGQFDAPIATKSFSVPSEARLPSTFGIGAGAIDNALARIRVTGFLGAKPVVIREISIQVPKTRIAVVELELAYACRDQVKLTNGSPEPNCPTAGESCQPATGKCASSFVDVEGLPTYVPGTEQDAGKIVHIDLDSGSDGPPVVVNEAGPGEDVVEPKSSDKEITKFTIELGSDASVASVAAKIEGAAITAVLPYGTDLTHLAPKIEYLGASVSPSSGEMKDFTSPVTYTVTAQDGTASQYVAALSVAAAGSKEITSFVINGVEGVISGTSITVTLPSGTASVTSLVPNITHTGVSTLPVSGAAQNFTSPVKYTVKAADDTTLVYTVTVVVAASSAKDISSFAIGTVQGTVGASTVTLTLPPGTDPTKLAPQIGITGKSVSPASGAVRDFTSPVEYTVTAGDDTTKKYTVTVNIAPPSEKDITSFTIQGIAGTITADNKIALTLPFGSSLASQTPTIAITGDTVSPKTGVAQDFSAPVNYTVTAKDKTTKVYQVTVTTAANSAKDITAFSINSVAGTISGTNISVLLPSGTAKTSLTPVITATGTVSPAGARDFTNPVQYTVTAQDSTTKVYTVTVTVAASSAKDITAFTINAVAGTISGTNITLTLPAGTSKTNLVPQITATGSVTPASGVAKDFTNPVQYTVTAQDASTKVYTVTVTIAAGVTKDITSFVINGTSGFISGNTITVNLTAPADLSSLTPAIVINGQSVSPTSGTAQDFTAAKTYTVTAQDTSTKAYTVTVTQPQLATPQFQAPLPGTYGGPTTVKMSTPSAGTIHYTSTTTTTLPADPTAASASFPLAAGIAVNSGRLNIKAIATGTGYRDSAIASGTYVIQPVCGDGIVAGTEACDDHNNSNNDGCSASCTVESGYRCPTPGALCTRNTIVPNGAKVNFGTVDCGKEVLSNPFAFMVFNNGPATTLTATLAHVPPVGQFGLSGGNPLSRSVGADSSFTFNFVEQNFSIPPTGVPDSYDDTVTFSAANGAAPVTLPITVHPRGSYYFWPDTSNIAFSNTPAGTTAQVTRAFRNLGNYASSVDFYVQNTNGQSGPFTVSPNFDTIGPGETHSFVITYSPTVSGEFDDGFSLSAHYLGPDCRNGGFLSGIPVSGNAP